jgi:hypothetical protein
MTDPKPMTIGDLKEKLKEFDDDLLIFYPVSSKFRAAYFISYERMHEPKGIEYESNLNGLIPGIVIA